MSRSERLTFHQTSSNGTIARSVQRLARPPGPTIGRPPSNFGRRAVGVRTSAGPFTCAYLGWSEADNAWHHLVVTHSAASWLRLYVDLGSLRTNSSILRRLQRYRDDLGVPGLPPASADTLSECSTTSSATFNGLFGEVTVWNSGLTAAQVRAVNALGH